MRRLVICACVTATAHAFVSHVGLPASSSYPRPATNLPRRVEMQLDGTAVLSAVDAFYQTSPYQAAFLTCGIKASLSDSISQKSVEKVCAKTGEVTEHVFCFSRNLAFILYGGLYQGVIQYIIFNQVYPVIFGTGTDVATVLCKVAFDMLVLTPFLCLPVAYLVKALVFQYPLKEGLEKYVADAKKDLLLKYWAIWTPAQCLTFSVVPEHLRIPFIAMVSFFWLIILSSITSRSRPEPSAPGKAIICFDDQCIIAGEIDDEIDVSVLDKMDTASGFQFAMASLSGGSIDKSDASLEKLFAQIDGDGDGSISNEELVAALSKEYERLEQAAIEQMMAAADTDNDGEISLDEFKAIMCAKP